MKKYLLLIIAFLLSTITMHAQSDTWTQKADFAGTAREGAVGFSIGNKGYVGTGATRTDFWEYNPENNTWTQKANFIGSGTAGPTGFSINGKGYIGTGSSNTGVASKDFWEYDPVSNTWTRKADFAGPGRSQATSFSMNGKGYIGTGWSYSDTTALKDFWEYDPAADKWTRKADFPGSARTGAASFSINGKGYIGTGYSADFGQTKDFWEYDPATDKWTRIADLRGHERQGATGFAIKDKGYLGFGLPAYFAQELWEYNPVANAWTRKADLTGPGRAFAVGDKGYITTGQKVIDTPDLFLKDLWEYTPGEIICAAPSDLKVTNTTDTAARLQWTLPLTTVDGFLIAYRTVNANSFTKKLRSAANDHIFLKGLTPSTTYIWQMRSLCVNDSSASEWVAGPNFTTGSSFTSASIADASIAGKFTVYISPNPVTGNVLNLHTTNATANNYQLSVTDMQGRMLINQNILLNGSSNKIIDVSALPRGIYILKVINTKNEQQQIKFVKAN
jgi:N-acetylneuraminic acid mutarotase